MRLIDQQLQEYFEYCAKVRRMTDATLRTKRDVLNRFARITGIASMQELNTQVFNNWIKITTERGVSARSLNSYNAIILAAVRYFYQNKIDIPLDLLSIPKIKESGAPRRRFYAREEVIAVIANADIKTGLMARMMFDTGMRISEMTRLRLDAINGRRINFIGKGRKPREVYMTTATRKMLDEYLKQAPQREYVWGAPVSGEPPTTTTVRKWLKAAFLACGFDDFYPHALRHSFATDLQRRGASVAEIKEMLGHASIATTERYLHGFDGRLQELFDKYR